jgi:hypothetical protein
VSSEPAKSKTKLKDWIWATSFCIVVLFIINWYEDYSRNLPLDSYEVIAGEVVDKGTYSGKSSHGYFIRIKNNSGTYKLTIERKLAPNNFLDQVKDSQNARAKIYRDFEGIKFIELKIDNVFVVKRS